MLRRGLRSRVVPIPSTTSDKTRPIYNDFRKGLVTYVPNDSRPKESLSYMTDSRASSVGEYKTRQGCDFYSVPIGETVNVQVTSTTGAADKLFSTTTWLAEKLTAAATAQLSRVDVRLKNTSATGTVIVAVYSDDSGTPATLLARSSIASADITGSYAYLSARFIEAPTITNGTAYWVVVYTQTSGTGSYILSSTTNSTNAKTSTDGGQTWSSASYSLNAKLYTATAGGVKGMFRAYRPDGTVKTFMAHKTFLYTIDDVTGATTPIDTGIDANSTYVRFEYVNDKLYYVTGLQKPRVYDWVSSSEVSTALGNARSIIEHVGILFYLDSTDLTKMFFSNFAVYDTFTSTDFIYIPAPKRSDYAVGFGKLNGALYPFTRLNKYVLYGQDNATFRLDEAPAQKGSYTQESIVWDDNYIYFASDDGVYQFNGTSEKNLMFNEGLGILDQYMELLDKDNCVLEVHSNRLYVWYTPNGMPDNSRCFVYNLVLQVWESNDTQTFIGKAFGRKDAGNLFLQASNRIGAIYLGEQSTNDYTNLGEVMSFELRTPYEPFGKPEELKWIPYWRPHFQTTAGDYSVQCGFATDFSDDATYYDLELQGSGFTYDSADSLYDSATYAAAADISNTTLEMYGEAKRWQRRYKHTAAREPVEFTGETLQVESQRMV